MPFYKVKYEFTCIVEAEAMFPAVGIAERAVAIAQMDPRVIGNAKATLIEHWRQVPEQFLKTRPICAENEDPNFKTLGQLFPDKKKEA